MSGPIDAQEAVEGFRKRLAALETSEMNAMVKAYRPVNTSIRKQVQAITKLSQTQNLKPWQVMRLGMMKDLQKQIVGEMKQFAEIASTQITQGQAAAVALSQQATQATMTAGLPPGITPNMLARQGISWSRLPREAFANFVGISGDGAPLGNLLAPLGPQTATAVREGVGEGIALGYSPRKTADLVSIKSGMGLTRALAISRTETNRAFREASRLQYAANPDLIKGYRRMAAKDERTCIACIVLDGNLYGNDQALDAHVNCRCTIVPEALTYGDLGMNIPEPPKPEGALGWFNGQSPGVQSKMMGANKFKAFQAGEIDYFDFVKKTKHPIWGNTAVVAPAKEIVTDSGMTLGKWLAVESYKEIPISTIKKMAKPKVKPKGIETEAEVIPKHREVTNVSSRFQGPVDELDDMIDVGLDREGWKSLGSADEVATTNLLKLQETPDGEDLAEAITSWSNSGNSSSHRRGASKWVKGSDDFIGYQEEAGAKLAEAVSVSRPIKEPTFRGVNVQGRTIDQIELDYKVGSKFDSQISSFSIDKNIADAFAGSGGPGAGNTSVVFHLEPGAKGLKVGSVSSYVTEMERLIHGRFEVLRLERTLTDALPGRSGNTVLNVHIKQNNNFVREARR